MEKPSSALILETPDVAPVDAETGFDADYLRELGYDPETRSDTLDALNTLYGDRVFHYEPYFGTVADMEARCPDFGEKLEQGVAAASEWLETNDQPQQIEEDDETELANAEDDTTRSVQEVEETKEPKEVSLKRETKEQESAGDTERPADDEVRHSAKVREPEVSVGREYTPEATVVEVHTPEHSETIGALLQVAVDADRGNGAALPLADTVRERETSEPQEQASLEVIDSIHVGSFAVRASDDSQQSPRYALRQVIEFPQVVANELATASDDDMPLPKSPSQISDAVEQIVEGEDVAVTDFWYAGDVVASEEQSSSVTAEGTELAAEMTVVGTADDNAPVLDVPLNLAPSVPEVDDVLPKFSDVLMAEQRETPSDSEVPLAVLPEAVAVVTELIGQEPDVPVAVEIAGLYEQSDNVGRAIEQLQRAQTVEDCNESLNELRIELAILLRALGYTNAESMAEKLIKKYDVAALKSYIAALMYAFQVAEAKDEKSAVSQAGVQVLYHLYGAHAVRMVVNLVSRQYHGAGV